ncbi:MAG: hypothetical protein ACI865_000924 [Flavobacteriaceae bacterium]|jgi:hypothetical protein
MTDETLDQGIKASPQPSNQQGNKTLPSSGGILAMGIISIVLAGLIGIILAIIALSLSGKAEREYQANPGEYREGSYKNMKAGRVCAIIGVSISVLALIFLFGGRL